MKFIRKFIRNLRGTDTPMPRPLPEYRYIMMLVYVQDEFNYKPVWLNEDGLVQHIITEGEYSKTLSELFDVGRVKSDQLGLDLHILVLDNWEKKSTLTKV